VNPCLPVNLDTGGSCYPFEWERLSLEVAVWSVSSGGWIGSKAKSHRASWDFLGFHHNFLRERKIRRKRKPLYIKLRKIATISLKYCNYKSNPIYKSLQRDINKINFFSGDSVVKHYNTVTVNTWHFQFSRLSIHFNLTRWLIKNYKSFLKIYYRS
jgi:hypothetical protein